MIAKVALRIGRARDGLGLPRAWFWLASGLVPVTVARNRHRTSLIFVLRGRHGIWRVWSCSRIAFSNGRAAQADVGEVLAGVTLSYLVVPFVVP